MPSFIPIRANAVIAPNDLLLSPVGNQYRVLALLVHDMIGLEPVFETEKPVIEMIFSIHKNTLFEKGWKKAEDPAII